MDAAFGAVHVAIRFLQVKLSDQHTGLHVKSPTAEQIVNYICQQCEASLQTLQSLCQQKMFRERLLRNKVSKIEPSYSICLVLSCMSRDASFDVFLCV
jgi:hypothetical protein